MLRIQDEAVIDAEAAAVWRAWRPEFPIRPRAEESRNLDLYDLGGGLKVPVTLVAVDEMESWTLEHRLPMGRLVIFHGMRPEGGRRVRVSKRFDVHGPMSVVYRLFLSGRIRKGMPAAFAQLERDANAVPPAG